MDWYNNQRPHQALAYQTLMEKYREFMANKAPPLGQNLVAVDSRVKLQNLDQNFLAQ